jgi:hypothetical protein
MTTVEIGAGDAARLDEGAGERPAGHVPLAALHAERGRRQAAERERDDLLAQLKGAPGDEDEPGGEALFAAAEPADDPATLRAGEGESLSDLGMLNAQLNASEAVARASYGDAAVNAAEAWAEQAMQRDPTLAAQILAHPDPYAFALGYALSAQGPGRDGQSRARPTPPSPPPRSLASAPSAGGSAHVPAGPGQAYDSLFSQG